MEPIINIMLIAALGGLLRSFLGYRRTPEGEDLDYLRLGQTIVTQIFISMFVVFGAAELTGNEIGTYHYILTLFLAVDVQTMMKTRK